ncbi:hypothetical protein SNEBB_009244 [Seison nebaliae]|nr:hypothetical protein SNEBB_009244 [Seison nebaliae]
MSEFIDRTTIHGIPWMIKSSKIKKALWLLIICGSTCFLVYNVWTNLDLYVSHPKQSDMTLIYDIPPFPAFTICNNLINNRLDLEEKHFNYLQFWSRLYEASKNCENPLMMTEGEMGISSFCPENDYDELTNEKLKKYMKDDDHGRIFNRKMKDIIKSFMKKFQLNFYELYLFELLIMEKGQIYWKLDEFELMCQEEKKTEQILELQEKVFNVLEEKKNHLLFQRHSILKKMEQIDENVLWTHLCRLVPLEEKYEHLSSSLNQINIFSSNAYDSSDENQLVFSYINSFYELDDLSQIMVKEPTNLIDVSRSISKEEDFIMYCRVDDYLCNGNMFTQEITDRGICVTLRNARKYHKDIQDFYIYWNTFQYNNLPSMRIDKGELIDGIVLDIHDDNEAPQMEGTAEYVSGVKIDIHMTYTRRENLREKDWGVCANEEKLDEISKFQNKTKYTKSACIHACLCERIRKNCKCFATFDARSTSKDVCQSITEVSCQLVTKHKFKENECKECKEACEINIYDFQSSIQPTEVQFDMYNAIEKIGETCEMGYFNLIQNGSLTYEKVHNDLCLNNNNYHEKIIQLQFKFGDAFYERNTQRNALTFVTVLSNIGGSMGLCIGMSLVTFFEFIELMLIKVEKYEDINDWTELTEKTGINIMKICHRAENMDQLNGLSHLYPNITKIHLKLLPTYVVFQNGKEVGRFEGDKMGPLVSKLKNLHENYLFKLISSDKVKIFMKGTPEQPLCKFSREMVQLLSQYPIQWSHFNILENEEVRQGLKTYSDWPTYPQIYVNTQLIGGLDILKQLHENGTLNETLTEFISVMDGDKLILNQPIVIDNGTGTLKAGFAGDDKPKYQELNYIGYPKYQRAMTTSVDKENFIGSKAETFRGLLRMNNPMDCGVVTNWDDMEKIWRYMFSKENLNVNPIEHPVLITETPWNPQRNAEKITEIFFETFTVPAMMSAMQAVLVLYASGKTSGVVLDSGEGVTHAVPIVEGFSLNHCICRNDIAGREVTKYFRYLLRKEGYKFNSTAEFDLVRQIKENVCLVQTSSFKNMESKESLKYKLPDGNIIDINTSFYNAPEVLFNPTLIGDESPGVHEILRYSVAMCDLDLRKNLYQSIILAGGTTIMKNFPDRLMEELKQIAPKDIKLKIHASRDRASSAWIGGSILASLGSFTKMWVTKKEYEEVGKNLMRKKGI